MILEILFSRLGPSGAEGIIRNGMLNTARETKKTDPDSIFVERAGDLLEIQDNDLLFARFKDRGYDVLLFLENSTVIGYAAWQKCGLVYNLFALYVDESIRCKGYASEFVRRFLKHVYAQTGERGSAIIGAGRNAQVAHICMKLRSNGYVFEDFDTYPGLIKDVQWAVGFRKKIVIPEVIPFQAQAM